jgi:hypothetical protein
MMVVMIRVAQENKINRQDIFGSIGQIKISISEFMGPPIDNISLQGSHRNRERQQKKHPPRRCVINIKGNIKQNPTNACNPVVTYVFQPLPIRKVFFQIFIYERICTKYFVVLIPGEIQKFKKIWFIVR